MLEARNVTFHYGRVQALDGASVRVDAGEIVVLLGPNGAGKTTTLRVLSGLVTPAGGRVFLDDQDVTGKPAEHLASAGVAHIPDNRGIFPRLTVEQNLLVGLYTRRRSVPGAARRSRRPSSTSRPWNRGSARAPAYCRGASNRCSRWLVLSWRNRE